MSEIWSHTEFRRPFDIDEDFRAVLPRLSEDEHQFLEESILRDGCRDPLVLWEETYETGWCKQCEPLTDWPSRALENDDEETWTGRIEPAGMEVSVRKEDGRWVCEQCEEWGCHPETYLLLDGHERYEICTRHNLDYDVTVINEEIEMPTREDAIAWRIANQVCRRNLSADQMRLLRSRQDNQAQMTIQDKNDNSG